MTMNHSIGRAIILGGLVAGSVDIGAAALINWRAPVFILQVIAGGLLGMGSFSGGMYTAFLGLFLQWAMSLLIAAIYVIASEYLPALKRHWIAGGLAYGFGIFAVMNYVVFPLSAYRRFPHFTLLGAGENLLAMFLFGILVAFFARQPHAQSPATK
jgi:uncharacterized membrane protein YagU involved in acid resistance